MRYLPLLLAASFVGSRELQPQRVVAGTTSSRGQPLAGVNVFVRESLEGVLTDSLGRFRIVVSRGGPIALVAQRIGFTPRTISIREDSSAGLRIDLDPVAATLAPVTATAGRFAAGEERGAALTTLDVVATAGSTADVARAIQTLPGAQGVDEGTALYVRGGDYSETRVLLNDAVLRTPFSYESPNGTFIGTVDPFLLDGIVFSSGGFGARYGDALSAVVALRSLGAVPRSSATVGAGLAALSSSAAVRLGDRLSVRVAANQSDTRLMFRVNGSTTRYDPPPIGFDRSGSIVWRRGAAGEVKLMVVGQRTKLGTELQEAAYTGTYDLSIDTRLAVLGWSDSIGRITPFARVSQSGLRRNQDYGNFRHDNRDRYSAGAAGTGVRISDDLSLNAGVEWERIASSLQGSIPQFSYDRRPLADKILYAASPIGEREGGYVEADGVVATRARVVAGLRADRSTLAKERTADPRLSAAVTLVPGVVLSGAWGIYHQLPDPLFYDAKLGDTTLSSMRASHLVGGLQVGGEGMFLRVEAYRKRYSELAQTTREYKVVGGGAGTASGVDVFVAGGFPGVRWRTSASFVSSRRTDPNTGEMSAAPFDVPRTITSVVQHELPGGWHLGITHRIASGRPFTPVTSASYDTRRKVWIPQYGRSMSERLPAFRRVDLGLTHLQRVGAMQGVLYLAVNNVFDRENVFAYRYTSDYATRIAIRSLFNRSYYFGFSLTKEFPR